MVYLLNRRNAFREEGPPAGGRIIWYDADAAYVTKDGSNYVSQWDDKSGNGHHLTQSSGSYQPRWFSSQVNGYPSIYFNVDYLKTSSFTFNQPCTYYVVLNGQSGGYYDALMNGLWGSTSTLINRTATGNYNYYAGSNVVTNIPFSYQSYDIVMCCFNGSSSFLKENTGSKYNGNPGSANPSGFSLGMRVNSYQYVGYIAEVLGYNVAHNDSQIAEVMGYLNEKYSIY